ncbi:MAG: hypothetical protein QOI85_1833 [Chloroflexota bacterium]|nr:hypothetical protein [Chloroflexota bacterium]
MSGRGGRIAVLVVLALVALALILPSILPPA